MDEENRVLVVAAHPDDEVLGCGGTIHSLAKIGFDVHVLILADGESSRTETLTRQLMDERNAAAKSANKIIGTKSLEILELPDNRLDELPLLSIVKKIEDRILNIQPKTIFTHYAGDVNVDHKVVREATVAACRPYPDQSVKELLFFETASSTEWQPTNSAFSPNYFFDISDVLSIKMEALRAYETEMRDFPHPRSYLGVEAQARWRGASAGVMAAEAFQVGRIIRKVV